MATPLENAPFTEELFNGVTFLTQVLSAGGGWVWKTNMAGGKQNQPATPPKTKISLKVDGWKMNLFLRKVIF